MHTHIHTHTHVIEKLVLFFVLFKGRIYGDMIHSQMMTLTIAHTFALVLNK